MKRLKPDVLRATSPNREDLEKIKRNPIYIVLDNVMDTYNVGAIFRLADAIAAEKVILCGETETPPNTRIKKASINTTEWVTWSYASTTVKALQDLKTQNSKLKIIGIEQDSKSVPFDKVEYQFPIAFVVGHETNGISKEVLDMTDKIVELPMYGINTSLNVMVSLGIVLYQAIKYLE
ncbi:MAG: RNA methyltransferase [Candidatus Levybacteria bacterium CG_4_10_14_0_2_um_filter_35_8]|nr:MAG: RNA methyltransferase [Candidatus Levybacteria bacterium CG_4_10_14_0_2_um_filter_35_8]